MSTLSGNTSIHSPVHKTSHVKLNPVSNKTEDWQFQKKMKLEREEKRFQREMEMEENNRIREREKEWLN